MTDDTLTPLDDAYQAMEAHPDDDRKRLGFYERLADSELMLLLEKEPEDDEIAPKVFMVKEGAVALVFDREERLAEFVGAEAHYAVLSGRGIVTLLTGQGLGLGVNLGVAPSSMLLPADGVDWLADTLANRPELHEDVPQEVRAPGDLPESFVTALDTKLATAAGLARCAYLAQVTYANGRVGHLLAFVDPLADAEPALAQAVTDALSFSGIEAGSVDVAFLSDSHPMAASLDRHGLRFDLPAPKQVTSQMPDKPGSDPDTPPKLR